jgi:hypothetical protein
MATRYWVYREELGGPDTQISGPFEREGAATHTAALLTQETGDDTEYYAQSPHDGLEATTVREVFGP